MSRENNPNLANSSNSSYVSLQSANLMNPVNYLPYKKNNCYFNVENTKVQYPIISELILAHPLRHIITYNPNQSDIHVPEVYLQQFWNTVHESVTESGVKCLTATVEQHEIQVTYSNLRSILKLPKPHSYPPKTTYDLTPTGSTLLYFVKQLGYNGQLHKVGDFKRNRLAPMWQTLHAIVNRCVTGIHTGIDTGSTYSLQFLIGMAYHMHLDYAMIIWTDILKTVNKKNCEGKREKFIPYLRFFTMILEQILRVVDGISKRQDHKYVEVYEMLYVYSINPMPGVETMEIPEELVRMMDQESVIVQEYMRDSDMLPTEQQEPADPSQGALGAGEGPSDRGLEEQEQEDVPVREEIERENQERGGEDGEGGAIREGANRFDPTAEKSNDSILQADDDSDRTQSAQSVYVAEKSVLIALDDTKVTEVTELASPSYTLVFEQTDSHVRRDLYDTHEPIHTEDVQSSPSIAVDPSIYGGFDDDDFVMDLVCEEIEKTKSERVARKENSESEGSPKPESREARFAIGLNLFQSGIEQNIVIPAMQSHIPTSHSIVSQQATVSLHGDLTHTPSATYSEFAGVETSRPSLLSTSILQSQSSLEQFRHNIFLPSRTRNETSARLGDVAEAFVVAASTCQPQGSNGSPTRANDMPTLSVGHTVPTTGVSTGNLSDPGVRHGFISSEFLDGAPLETLKENPIAEKDYSIDELLSLLHAKLSNVSSPTKEHSALISALQVRQDQSSALHSFKDVILSAVSKMPENVTNTISQNDLISALQARQDQSSALHSFKDDILSAVSKMSEKVTNTLSEYGKRIEVLETTCKAQSGTLKRRHYDRDDLDRHEGEKQRRYIGEFGESYQRQSAERIEFVTDQAEEWEIRKEDQGHASGSGVEKPLPVIEEEKEVFETEKLNRVFFGVTKEVHDLFPPEKGQFNITATDIISQNKEKEKREKETETFKWPVSETYHKGSKAQLVLAGSSSHTKRTRDAMKKTELIWADRGIQVAFLEDRVQEIYTDQLEEMAAIELINLKDSEQLR